MAWIRQASCHAFWEASALREAAVGVSDSALQLSDTWLEMEHLDDAMPQVAWQCGAWDLVREKRRGGNTAGASEREALQCRQAFTEDPFDRPAEELMLADASCVQNRRCGR